MVRDVTTDATKLTLTRGVMAACLFLLLSAGSASAQVFRFGNEEEVASTTPTPLAIAGLPEPPAVVDASNASSCALEPSGRVYAWGYGANGELGDGGAEASINTAVEVKFPPGVTIRAIGEARRSCFAIDTTGKGWAWGEGAKGMFCNGAEDLHVPKEVPVTGATAVQGGSDHVLWLLKNGTVMGCGENRFGQLGLEKSVKTVTALTVVPGPSNVTEISAGWGQSLERTAGGTVYAFGSNGEGRVCESRRTKNVFGPTQVNLPGAASEISAGGDVSADGSSMFMVGGVPYGCGDDKEGQIGDGKTADKYAPAVASELLTLGLTRVVTAGRSSLGVSSSGQVYTWGSGSYGDLGNDSEGGLSLSPFPVAGGTNVSVAATAHNMTFWEGA